jgi:hypothetical protein
MEVASFVVGGVSLLAGFRTAIDGYLFIESLLEEDNGIRSLVLDYKIECHKLEVWGDSFNVKTDREEDCLLYHESDKVKALMAQIFGRIAHHHTQAEKFLVHHEAQGYDVDYAKLSTPPTGFNKQLQLKSTETKAMSKAQKEKKQKKRVKWVIKNKAKFEEIVR